MPFNLISEPQTPLFTLNASCTLKEGGNLPPNIIDTTQDWSVDFNVTQNGLFSGGLLIANYVLSVYMEPIGSGSPVAPHSVNLIYQPAKDFTYPTQTVSYPAGAVTNGIYRLVTSVTAIDTSSNPFPMAAFGDGGMIQFYTA